MRVVRKSAQFIEMKQVYPFSLNIVNIGLLNHLFKTPLGGVLNKLLHKQL